MAVILLSSIVIKFLTKVGWCLVLFANVMVRLIFLAMHALWLPYYVSAWFRQLVCLTLPKSIQDELFGICVFRCRMLNIPIHTVTIVCGALFSLRDSFFILPNSCFQLFVSHCPMQCETKSLETEMFVVELCTF